MRSEVELRKSGLKISNIRMDRAGERTSDVVKLFCLSNGIKQETSPPFAPQSNEAAES